MMEMNNFVLNSVGYEWFETSSLVYIHVNGEATEVKFNKIDNTLEVLRMDGEMLRGKLNGKVDRVLGFEKMGKRTEVKILKSKGEMTWNYLFERTKPEQKKTKNWEQIVADAESSDEEKGNPEKFFQKIYQNADDDTKRAMMKSYVESGAQEINTQWGEVEKKQYTKAEN
eukprot:Trichotokara_eunicae@DN5660_c0_g1_i3.p1